LRNTSSARRLQLVIKRAAMKVLRKPSFRSFKVIIFLSFGALVLCYFFLIHGKYENEVTNLKRVVFNRDKFINQLAGVNDMKYPFATDYERKDWHDYEFIKYEAKRVGPGEQGKPFELTDPIDIALNNKLFQVEGLFVIVSDKISVNRSVPDVRLPQ